MASFVYNGALELLGGDTAGLVSSPLIVLLLRESYVPDRDHLTVATIVAHEVTVAGYVRQPLVSPVVTRNDAMDRADLDAPDVMWAGLAAGQTAAYAVIAKDGANDAARRLISCHDIVNTATGGPPLQVIWRGGSVLRFTSPLV